MRHASVPLHLILGAALVGAGCAGLAEFSSLCLALGGGWGSASPERAAPGGFVV